MKFRFGRCMFALVGVLAGFSSCSSSSHRTSGASVPSAVNVQTGSPSLAQPTPLDNATSVPSTVNAQLAQSPAGDVDVQYVLADYPSYPTADALFQRAETAIIATAVSVGSSFLFVDAPASLDGIKPIAQHLETPISYQVERVLSGTGVKVGQTITSLVTGGSIAGRRDVNPSDPVPTLKKRYLLFVERTEDPTYTHRVLGDC
jgi:hypothetical protein